jgi:prepilin-type N-terminal cleavage/methylation domain-containing protein
MKKGFTLIELLVTLAIMVVIGGVVFVGLSGKRGTSDLTSTTQQIETLLRQAQTDSMTQKNEAAWGVHFYNATGTGSFYALFSGTYNAGTAAAQYALPGDIEYSPSSVPLGGTLDVTFAQVTGIPSASTSITLYLVVGESGTVTVSTSPSLSRQSSGKIFFDNFNRSSL